MFKKILSLMSGTKYTRQEHVNKVVNSFFELISDLSYSGGDVSDPFTNGLVIPVKIGNNPDYTLHTKNTPHINPLLFLSMKEFEDEEDRLNSTPNFKGQLGKQKEGGSIYVANSTETGDWAWIAYGSYEQEEGKDSVQHYHWDYKKVLGNEVNHTIILGIAELLGTWDYTLDDALKHLNFRGNEGPGIQSKWGPEFVVSGSIEFSEGDYYFDNPVKLIPLCTLRGPASQGSFERDAAQILASDDWNPSNLYLIDGAYRNGSTSNSNFHTNLQGLHLRCRGIVDRGVYISVSQGSAISDIDVDSAVTCAFFVAPNCDDFTIDRCTVQNLNETRTKYGWWFEDGVKVVSARQLTTDYCDVGLSFGAIEAVDISAFECEKCILPIEIREKNHPNIDGTAGDEIGNPGGMTIRGIRALRDETISPDRVLAKVRYNATGSGELLKTNLILEGWADGNGSDLPYDRVQVQENSGTIYEYPLRWDLGFDRTIAIFDFRFDLMKMILNRRFRSDRTIMLDSRLCISDNPTTPLTTNGFRILNPLPGMYRIEFPSSNNYGGGSLTFYKNGTAIPSLTAIISSQDVYYHHDGGAGSLSAVLSGSVGTVSVQFYVRPWFL